MIPLFFLAMAAEAPAAAGSDAPTAQMEKLLQDCDAHKFETVVDTVVGGTPHQSKVKLCGTKGQSDAAWTVTLRDAAAKVKANDKMAPETRAQIVTAIDAELERLGHPDSMALIANSAPSPSIVAPPAASSPLAALAPRAAAGAATVAARPLSQDYGGLPPLPAPTVVAAAGAIGTVLPSVPAPRMTLECSTTDDPKDVGRCGKIITNSLFTIHADEAFSDTSLRFLRRGDERAEVKLAQLRAGQSTRFALPAGVCQGVANSEVEIEVVRRAKGPNDAGQVVDRLGPYDLHC
ncbi:hypothetical protein [Sphingomonas sp. URHD0057]|uniref:hypothetical protein n=1 Tax=Sphingomonas sp. URHD0057 TaxID=1380389 RepID=UPI000491AA52|nr:hypothetical protein [Sphingomonas sp. URHD0057]